MHVFFSFSSPRSRAAADQLSSWLRRIVQSVEPWISTEIEKGVQWPNELSRQLENVGVGIICLAEEDLHKPWILFEAGAISKSSQRHVCTFLLDNIPDEIALPLAQFQATVPTKEDIRRLVHTMNDVARSRGERALSKADLDHLYEQLWPELKAKLDEIPEPGEDLAHPLDHTHHSILESRALKLYQAEHLQGHNSVPASDEEATNGRCRYERVGASRRHIMYGPYDALRQLGRYVAFFRIKITDDAPYGPLFYLEVSGGGKAGISSAPSHSPGDIRPSR